jgi:hypothetical protein
MEKLATLLGIVIGFFFGVSMVSFLLNLINFSVTEGLRSIGSGAGLIFLIVAAVFLIFKLRVLVSLLSGIIVGVVIDTVLKNAGIDVVEMFFNFIGL